MAAMKAVFIDRDGVINKDPGGWTEYEYVTAWKDFHFLPGVFDAFKLLKKHGIEPIIISNQAGVGRGYFSREALMAVTAEMRAEITRHGGEIRDVFYCLHTSDDHCACRKPAVGLFEQAIQKYGIDPRASYFIGDTERDIIAGNRIGCRTILVLSGKATRDDAATWQVQPDSIVDGLLEAVREITKGAV